ncbi:MAG: bifunctional 4-hydroxy-2-oxoglutarate aldolase/2-dehydro-3-deoxy-phosphogluconate aldolase [Psychromonas sp.]|nr:bifunctional 4-hydroxy-2-oxoglutarate aldolase/2-dehydro-3-deoxy-phosphogluconate aldolase [Alteromonadales bacterium]MCP5078791.1 bifunctional 4-hydroxy-2-oxoglutarate aldolase/2-dehydro-3-deoxy-phosphogluconate aldolase [Psychromonas sp.]
MPSLIQQLSEIKIIPVIQIDDAKLAVPLAKALSENGLPAAEVTFRTAAAAESIRRIKDACPDMLLGAGTILNAGQVDAAFDAGASFMVSPGLNPNTVKYCQDKGVPIVPGINNPSQVELGLELGLDFLKFFPAEASGGINMLKSLLAPYVDLKLMPTGGINANNALDHLNLDRVICCGGTWMVAPKLINSQNWDEIARLTRQAALLVK